MTPHNGHRFYSEEDEIKPVNGHDGTGISGLIKYY